MSAILSSCSLASMKYDFAAFFQSNTVPWECKSKAKEYHIYSHHVLVLKTLAYQFDVFVADAGCRLCGTLSFPN
jgi:hypothetical protein